MRNVVTIPHNSIAVPTELLYPFLFPYSSRSFDFVHAARTPFEKGYGSCVCFDRFIGQCDGFVRSVALLLLFSTVPAARDRLYTRVSAAALVRIMWEGNFMEILIAIFIVACLAVIYYWIFDAKQKEKQELIKEQINGLIESHTNQLKSEGVNVDTVYTYQDNAFKQLDWSKAVAFRLIVDVANRQIVICNDLSNPFSPQKIPFEKIINCEVLSKNGWLSRKGISRAVVGGVIGGGAGAIIGASSAQKSIAKIVIYTSDITTPSVTIDLYAKKNDTWDFDNERDAFAQQVCASIKAIIANQ